MVANAGANVYSDGIFKLVTKWLKSINVLEDYLEK
jgi:hypothetical protein